MKVKVDFGDGTDEEEIEVTDGSMHFHPYEDGEKHDVTVTLPPEAEEEAAADDAVEEEVLEEDEFFDPADHTVADVEAFVNENPELAQDVLDAEVAGKNRVTLVDWLEDHLAADE